MFTDLKIPIEKSTLCSARIEALSINSVITKITVLLVLGLGCTWEDAVEIKYR